MKKLAYDDIIMILGFMLAFNFGVIIYYATILGWL